MPFSRSAYPDVRNYGNRYIRILLVLKEYGWDTTALDTALKALRTENGGVPLPNGVNETVTVLKAVFELRPQIMQQAFKLAEVEYSKATSTLTGATLMSDLTTAAGGVAPSGLWMPGYDGNTRNGGLDPTVDGERVYNIVDMTGNGYDMRENSVNAGPYRQDAVATSAATAGPYSDIDTVILVDSTVGFWANQILSVAGTGEWMRVVSVDSGIQLTVERGTGNTHKAAIAGGTVLTPVQIGTAPCWVGRGEGANEFLRCVQQFGAGPNNLIELDKHTIVSVLSLPDHNINNSTVGNNPSPWGHNDNSGPFGDAVRPYMTIRDTGGGVVYFVSSTGGAVTSARGIAGWDTPMVLAGRFSAAAGYTVSVDKAHGVRDAAGVGNINSLAKTLHWGMQKFPMTAAWGVQAVFPADLSDVELDAVVDVMRQYQGLPAI